MELFERIRYLSEKKGYSLAKMAKGIDVAPQAFHKWLNAGSQRNLWEHLPALLKMFPDVRPEWLYMGQPPAFFDGTGPQTPPAGELEALRTRVAELEEELTQVNRLNRALLEKLLRLLEEDEGRAP